LVQVFHTPEPSEREKVNNASHHCVSLHQTIRATLVTGTILPVDGGFTVA